MPAAVHGPGRMDDRQPNPRPAPPASQRNLGDNDPFTTRRPHRSRPIQPRTTPACPQSSTTPAEPGSDAANPRLDRPHSCMDDTEGSQMSAPCRLRASSLRGFGPRIGYVREWGRTGLAGGIADDRGVRTDQYVAGNIRPAAAASPQRSNCSPHRRNLCLGSGCQSTVAGSRSCALARRSGDRDIPGPEGSRSRDDPAGLVGPHRDLYPVAGAEFGHQAR